MPLLGTGSAVDSILSSLQAMGSGIKAMSYDPQLAVSATNPADQTLRLIRIDVTSQILVTGVKMLLAGSLTALGTSPAKNKVALYGLGTTGISLLAASADTPTLLTQSAGLVGAAFTAPVTIPAGVYWAGILSALGTGPTGAATQACRVAPLSSVSSTLDLPANVKSNMSMTGQSDLPGAIGTPNVPLWTALSNNASTQPFVVLY